MTLLTRSPIGLGASANDGTGDSLRVGGDKINDNFDMAYWDRVEKLASDFVTGSTTSVDITAFLVSLAANKLYEFEAFLIYQSTTTAGLNFKITNPSNVGATVTVDLIWFLRTTSVAAQATGASVFGASSVSTTAATEANVKKTGWVKGHLVTGAAGTPGSLQFQLAKLTSGNATLHAGSYIRIRELA